MELSVSLKELVIVTQLWQLVMLLVVLKELVSGLQQMLQEVAEQRSVLIFQMVQQPKLAKE